jgi:hypothetical protein
MGNSISFFSVMMIVPCHHGMARPQVADGWNGLRIWKVAADME